MPKVSILRAASNALEGLGKSHAGPPLETGRLLYPDQMVVVVVLVYLETLLVSATYAEASF